MLLMMMMMFDVTQIFRDRHRKNGTFPEKTHSARHLDGWSPYKPKFHVARHVSTRHVRRIEPVHFDCVELVELHCSTRSTVKSRHVTSRHDTFDVSTRHFERVVSRRDIT